MTDNNVVPAEMLFGLTEPQDNTIGYLIVAMVIVVLLICLTGIFGVLVQRQRKILHEIVCMERGHEIVCTRPFEEWSEEERRAVKMACIMSSFRNSTRDNNVCQSLSSGFRRVYNALENNEPVSESELNLMKERLNYWAWSIGEGNRPKLFSLPR